jgi:hypothetical protein
MYMQMIPMCIDYIISSKIPLVSTIIVLSVLDENFQLKVFTDIFDFEYFFPIEYLIQSCGDKYTPR